MTALLLLGGCSAFSANWMSAKGGAPFRLGAVKSALWLEDSWSDPSDGEGAAWLLLTEAERGCGDLEDEMGGDVDREDSLVWDKSGVLAWFGFDVPSGESADWEGEYWSAYGQVLSYDEELQDRPVRTLSVVAWADGSVYETYGMQARGEIEGHGDKVVGTLDHELLKAKFQAEDCGQIEGSSWDDTGWYERR